MSEKQPHPEDADRWADGTVRPGNQAARKHGVYAFENRGPTALPADLRVSVDEFRAQVIRDRGGIDGLTAIEGGYIRRLGELETVVRLLAGDLAARGLFTPRGRVRGTLSRWMESLDRWDRYAQRIGVESRKPALTLTQRLAAIVPGDGCEGGDNAELAPDGDGGHESETGGDGTDVARPVDVRDTVRIMSARPDLADG